MTKIKLKKVVHVSSEDEHHKAENLLNQDASQKWVGKKNDNSKHQVVFELEKPSQIRQIEIINESSAFIEILVGNEDQLEEDYDPILPVTSFMSPSESKSLINPNRLKIFTEEAGLAKNLVDKTWKRVKLICTQPFNREVQFGISAIRLYTQVSESEDIKDASKIQTGPFSLRKDLLITEKKEDNKVEENASVFEKWKRHEPKEEEGDEKRKKSELIIIKEDQEEGREIGVKRITTQMVKASSDSKSPVKKEHVSTNQILKGVVFALSGFQNPLRSEIRDKGIKLGAKYRPDWSDDCTHLVSAFSNTPKANQVRKEGGQIVTKDWIYDCEKRKKLIDWKLYEVEEPSDDSGDDETKPRKAAKAARRNINKLAEELGEEEEEYDEEEAENSDDRDFVVSDSDLEEEEKSEISEDEESLSEGEEEEEESFDSDESEKPSKKRKKSEKHAKISKKQIQKPKKQKTIKKKPKRRSRSSSSETEESTNEQNESESSTDIEEYKKRREKELKTKKKQQKEQSGKKKEQAKKEIEYEDEDEDEEQRGNKKKETKKSEKSTTSAKNSTSDIENENKAEWELPDFFNDKHFFLYGDFSEKKRNTLSRLIIAYAGFLYNFFFKKIFSLLFKNQITVLSNLHDYMADEVDYVITDKNWNDEFDESLKENPKLIFVSSDWLLACSKRKKLMSHKPFEIVPNAN